MRQTGEALHLSSGRSRPGTGRDAPRLLRPISGAMLHDVVEDTVASLDDIEEKFGDEVALLVDGVSKLDQIQFRSRAEAQAESFPKNDARDDRRHSRHSRQARRPLHNMQTLGAMPRKNARASRVKHSTSTRRSQIASASTASRVELEDLGFKHLYPFATASSKGAAPKPGQPATDRQEDYGRVQQGACRTKVSAAR